MTVLNTLKKVLYRLNKEEVKFIINYLNHQKKSLNRDLKSVQLIRLILKNENISIQELQISLNIENRFSLNKLINRLKEKIYELILLDNNLNKSISVKRNRLIFKVRKKLIIAEILFSRGINEDVEMIYDEIISISKKYEIYDTLLEALYAKQRFVKFKYGFNKSSKLKQEIDFYEDIREAYYRATEIYNRITSKINFSSSQHDYVDELEVGVNILAKDFQNTKSAMIGYHYYFLLAEFYQVKANLLNTRHSLNKLKNLLENNISIYTKNRFGNVLINIANNEFIMFNFDLSFEYAITASDHFKESLINLDIIKEFEFNILFHSCKFIEAEKVINELCRNSNKIKLPFIHSKLYYLFGCLKTSIGEYDLSNKLLDGIKEIDKDKEGWNIGKRILSIINNIELNKFEIVEFQIQNLEKHIKRTMKSKHIRKRDILIARLLIKLMNENFNFDKVYQSRVKYLELLASTLPDYCWNIKSPELIIFHSWFKQKALNKNYDHSIALGVERDKAYHNNVNDILD
jgi:hypothetical protein